VISFVVGDLTEQRVDAIVNAANEALAPGGGVCGAIRRAGGDEIFEECATLGGCKTGDAKATGAGRLPARFVIHAVGPVWHGGDAGEPELLASAHSRALEEAARLGCRTIAFPALSTGIYGYPPDRAAPVAVEAVAEVAENFDEVRFVFVDESVRRTYALAREAGDGGDPLLAPHAPARPSSSAASARGRSSMGKWPLPSSIGSTPSTSRAAQRCHSGLMIRSREHTT
jgi:O-acetyl-ADP-ribose deacetylase